MVCPSSLPGRNRLRFALLLVYAAVLAAVISARPLWTDEILQLSGTRDSSWSQLPAFVRAQPGQAPLGYMLQWLSIHAFGFSLLSARLPSALFSIVGCVALARRWPAAILWIALPIQFRYALEARPYEQALCFSLLATLAFFALVRRPGWPAATVYCLAVGLAVYSQPYAIFLQIGLVSALLFRPAGAKLFLAGATAVGLAAASFLPWYLAAAAQWRAVLADHTWTFVITPRFFLAPIREISGAGYPAALLLIGLAAFGWRKTEPFTRRALLLGIATAFLIPLTAFLAFHYFYATRQVFYLLVPLLLLSARGVAALPPRWRAAVLVLFLAVGMPKTISYFSDRSEDYRLASASLQAAANRGYCVIFTRGDRPDLYSFYAPSLPKAACGDLESVHRVVLPTSKYIDRRQFAEAEARLARASLFPVEDQPVSLLTLHFYASRLPK